MKKTLFLTLLLIFSIGIFAQKNIIKGRAFKVSEVFSFGIGYERLIDNHISVQLLYNFYGYDLISTDGGAQFVHSIVPEVRYYLGKKENKKAFLGVFTEVSKAKDYASNFPFPVGPSRIKLKEYIDSFASGALVGISNGTKKRWLFEFYIGGKNTFAIQTTDYLVGQKKIRERKDISKLKIRIGINLGYRF